MNNLIVSDTNIFIDLINGNLLEEFFNLPYKISTNILVLNEITDKKEFETLSPYITDKKLDVHEIDATEMSSIFDLKNASTTSSKLSLQDCSVWLYAKNTNARLLTGDFRLRKAAEKDGIKVSGILYVLDTIEHHKAASAKKLSKSLKQIMSKNKQARLPIDECVKRINKWDNQKTNRNQIKYSPSISD